jgi:Uncharacterised nucleotidyltransferase
VLGYERMTSIEAFSGPATADEPLWRAVDALVATATPQALHAHRLEAFAVERRRRLGLQLSPPQEITARTAALGERVALELLSRIREVCDGPLMVIKGPEVAALYPPRCRTYRDLDLLVPDAEAVQGALIADGFVEDGGAPLHHLAPLRLPGSHFTIEIHRELPWAHLLPPPPLAGVFAAAQPSHVNVPGVNAPSPAHHAVLLAAHGWQHQPLIVLRDLIDVAAAASLVSRDELDEVAAEWRVRKIWRTTIGCADALFNRAPRTTALKILARHLESARVPSKFEYDVSLVLSGFWGLPVPTAGRHAAKLAWSRLRPVHGQTWLSKLGRVRHWSGAQVRGPRVGDGWQELYAAAEAECAEAGLPLDREALLLRAALRDWKDRPESWPREVWEPGRDGELHQRWHAAAVDRVARLALGQSTGDS